jgi:hypothetical protein
MGNPLFELLGGTAQSAGNAGGAFGGISNIIAQYMNFRKTYNGDARAQIQQMLNNGQLTQDQFNQAAQLATQLQNLIGKR